MSINPFESHVKASHHIIPMTTIMEFIYTCINFLNARGRSKWC